MPSNLLSRIARRRPGFAVRFASLADDALASLNAETRSQELLLANIPASERKRWSEERAILIYGGVTGAPYFLSSGGGVVLLARSASGAGESIGSFCVNPVELDESLRPIRTARIPAADRVLTLALCILHDEVHFLKTAVYSGRSHLGIAATQYFEMLRAAGMGLKTGL